MKKIYNINQMNLFLSFGPLSFYTIKSSFLFSFLKLSEKEGRSCTDLF